MPTFDGHTQTPTAVRMDRDAFSPNMGALSSSGFQEDALVHGTRNELVSGDITLAYQSNVKRKIIGNLTDEIAKNETLTVTQNQTVNIGINRTLTVGGAENRTVTGPHIGTYLSPRTEIHVGPHTIVRAAPETESDSTSSFKWHPSHYELRPMSVEIGIMEVNVSDVSIHVAPFIEIGIANLLLEYASLGIEGIQLFLLQCALFVEVVPVEVVTAALEIEVGVAKTPLHVASLGAGIRLGLNQIW